jgi:hypothetical protein
VMTDELLELGGSLGVLSRSQVSLRTVIKDLWLALFVLRDWSEQIHGLSGVSSLALDDRTNERQMELTGKVHDDLLLFEPTHEGAWLEPTVIAVLQVRCAAAGGIPWNSASA